MSTPTPLDRRRFIAGLFGSVLSLGALPASAAQTRRTVLIQRSPLAGFQYHHGKKLWPQLHQGDALTLGRKVNNAHDARAVRVDWRGWQLGYDPNNENTAAAQILDREELLTAHTAKPRVSTNPWERIILAIDLPGQ